MNFWKTMDINESPEEYKNRDYNRVTLRVLGKSITIAIPFRKDFGLSLETRIFGRERIKEKLS